MSKGRAVILSVVTGAFGFACTGAADGDGGKGAGTGGGGAVNGTGGSNGGSGPLGGSAGVSGNATGGNGGGGAGAATGGSAGTSAGAGASGGAAAGGGAGTTGGAGASGGAEPGGGAGAGGSAGTSGGAASGGIGGSGGAGAGGRAGTGGGGGSGGMAPPGVLVFSRTTGYRHETIPDGVTALSTLATQRGWELDATEDPNVFSDSGLRPYRVVVFLSTSGDVLNPEQEAAFERYIRAGGGYAGIHAASTTEYDWAFYGGLVGAFFSEHPDIQQAVLNRENATHPLAAVLPATWRRTDEWYGFRTNPRATVTVLLTIDETSYQPGGSAMGDHPIAWCHEYMGARSFYTALGHTRESYTEATFLTHVRTGIEWAARLL